MSGRKTHARTTGNWLLIFFMVAIFAVGLVAAGPHKAAAQQDYNSLRIYGQEYEDAAFPYTDPNGPFSVNHWEATPKDFVV